jgi:hypothetical protein
MKSKAFLERSETPFGSKSHLTELNGEQIRAKSVHPCPQQAGINVPLTKGQVACDQINGKGVGCGFQPVGGDVTSSFFAIKLDKIGSRLYLSSVKSPSPPKSPNPTIAKQVRARIQKGGERLWRLEDFRGQSFTAVAQTLSRMARDGELQRLSKGTYYRPGRSNFGHTLPNQTKVRALAARSKTLFPAGTGAANLLGFTTQVARQTEVATLSGSLPRKLIGADIKIHTRRPEAWKSLTDEEAAMLDFLRRGGRDSELTPEETTRRMIRLLSKSDAYTHLIRVAHSEPPRVRAILGAFGERLDARKTILNGLRQSLNPLSRFDFGNFSNLPNARAWQAKGSR